MGWGYTPTPTLAPTPAPTHPHFYPYSTPTHPIHPQFLLKKIKKNQKNNNTLPLPPPHTPIPTFFFEEIIKIFQELNFFHLVHSNTICSPLTSYPQLHLPNFNPTPILTPTSTPLQFFIKEKNKKNQRKN